MRQLLLFFLLLLPLNAAALTDYQLEVTLQPAEQTLQAEAIIALDEMLPLQLEFRLAEDCRIIAILQNGQPLPFSFQQGILQIEVKNRQPLHIKYYGRFADPVSKTPVHNEDPSYGVSATISADGSFLSAAANWYPRLEKGDINYRLTISAPPGYEAISSGRRTAQVQTEKQSRSSWLVDYPLYGLTLSAGPYQVFSDDNGVVPIYAYFYPESASFAPVYLQAAREYLQLYQQRFGDYPFHKFAVVENFFPTGYGFPSWTLLGSSVIRLPFIVKTSLGHEMAHSWWGTGVRVDYRQGNWAEGLTTYVADYLYKERSSAAEAQEYRLKILRDYAVLVDEQSDVPLHRFMSRHDRASQSIGYGKAAMLFHMLRGEIGDERFWTTLKKIAEERMFQQIGWDDFNRYFSAAAETDLSGFFAQWLQQPAGPILTLENVKVEQTATGYQTNGWLRQQGTTYRLQIPLLLETATEKILDKIELTGPAQRFSLHSQDRPQSLTADPHADLFRILDEKEIPATVNEVRGSRQLLAIQADRLLPSAEAMQTILGAIRKSDLQIKTLAEVSPQELASHDLLLFGTSDNLQPGELQQNTLTLAGERHQINAQSVFLVHDNPFNEAYVASWFLSAENTEDVAVARKIPHYGKYSYLVFAGKDNRQKGTFPPQKSPLRVELND